MSKSKLIVYGIAVIASLVLVCACIVGMTLVIPSTPTSTPAVANLSTIVVLTGQALQAQTQAALPPIPTLTASPLPTATLEPIQTMLPTDTPIPTTTILLIVEPTQPPQVAVCSCTIDLNCPNFQNQAEAQACFDYCGPGDVHNLDRDKDGIACEETNY